MSMLYNKLQIATISQPSCFDKPIEIPLGTVIKAQIDSILENTFMGAMKAIKEEDVEVVIKTYLKHMGNQYSILAREEPKLVVRSGSPRRIIDIGYEITWNEQQKRFLEMHTVPLYTAPQYKEKMDELETLKEQVKNFTLV